MPQFSDGYSGYEKMYIFASIMHVKQYIQVILLWLPMLILLGHNTIPHHHHDVDGFAECSGNHSSSEQEGICNWPVPEYFDVADCETDCSLESITFNPQKADYQFVIAYSELLFYLLSPQESDPVPRVEQFWISTPNFYIATSALRGPPPTITA